METVIRVEDSSTNDASTVALAFSDQLRIIPACQVIAFAEAEFCYTLEDKGNLSLVIDYKRGSIRRCRLM